MNRFNRYVFAAAVSISAGTLGFALQPATAAERGATVTPAATPTAARQQPTAAQRYCVVYTPTGSHIQHRECHTRAEWLEEGVDPTKPE
jgi:hypothetical protein